MDITRWPTLNQTEHILFSQRCRSYMLLLLLTAAKSLHSCPTLCDPIDSSPPGSPVPGILQERTPEWVAISFSNASKWKVKVKSLNRVRLFTTPWTAAYQAPSSMGFSSKSTGVGCHCRRSYIQSAKTRQGADCGSDHELLIVKHRFKLKKVGKPTRPFRYAAAAAAAKSLESCLTLCDPIDSSPLASPSLGFYRQEYWSGLPLPFPIQVWPNSNP